MEIYLWKVVCVICVLLLNATGSFSQLDVCGRPPLNPKIVGGGDAAPGAWPWQVSLQIGGIHFCGGSLINEIWVLTAAQCFGNLWLLGATVNLGMQNLKGNDPNKMQRGISKLVVHGNYNYDTKDNDIALLELNAPVTFNNYVMPVCLAATESNFPSGTNVWVTGWGNIGSNVSLPYPETLQEVNLPIVSNSNCAKSYGSNIITNNTLCAGRTEGGKDSCQGDAGGPLVVKQNTAWVQGGIVSFGYGCALPNFPGGYTRVSQYQNWINSIITTKQPGFVTVSNDNLSTTSPSPSPSPAPAPSPNFFCLFLSFSIISFLLSLSIF